MDTWSRHHVSCNAVSKPFVLCKAKAKVRLTEDSDSLAVPGRGCEEAERQSSSVVPRRCSGGAGRSHRTRAHQPAECKAPRLAPFRLYTPLIDLID